MNTWYIAADKYFQIGGGGDEYTSHDGGCSIRMHPRVAKDMLKHNVRIPNRVFSDKRYTFMKDIVNKSSKKSDKQVDISDPSVVNRIAALNKHIGLINEMMDRRETVNLDKAGGKAYRIVGEGNGLEILVKNSDMKAVNDIAENFHTIVGVIKILEINTSDVEVDNVSGAKDVIYQLLELKMEENSKKVAEEVVDGWILGASDVLVNLGKGVANTIRQIKQNDMRSDNKYTNAVIRDPSQWISPNGIILSRGELMNLRDMADNLP